jgi:signal transduction histidine kinase
MLGLLSGCRESLTSPDVLRFDRAHFVLADAQGPPADLDPRWRSIPLPDRWDERLPGQGGIGWYRFEVPGPRSPDDRLALSLAGVNMNAEAFVNGVPIGSGGRMVDPVARNANRPLYWELAGSLVGRPVNWIDVRLFAYANDVGSLGSVAFGADSVLRDEYRQRRFLQIELTQITTALVLLLAVFFGVLWLAAGWDPVHGWFALSAGAWTFVSLNYWVQDPGVAHWTWVRAFYLALGSFTVTIPIWAHRLLGIRRPNIERALLGILLLYAGVAVATSDDFFPRFVTPFQAVWLASGTYGVFVLLRGWRAFSREEAIVYGIGGVVCTALAALEQFDAWGLGSGWHPHLMPYIGSVLVLCLATTLGVRFSGSLQEVRRANRELEDRVRAKTAELEANHARFRELERNQVLAEERGRIVREMHDGIGGQLVATLAMVQAGEGEPRDIVNALRDALDDMRAVIDSMDPLVDDLGKLFGSLRARFEALLRRNDMRFVWSVGELQTTPWLGPEQYLHILRILQEAVANAIKHAAPSELEVSVARVDGSAPGLRIAVRDDGRRVAAAGGGRGIGHMQTRARALGGSLRIVELDPGTRVELWLPEPLIGG